MTDLFTLNSLINILCALALIQMAVILAMIETDRASKGEKWSTWFSRRCVFGIGGLTLIYGSTSHNWQFAFMLAAIACNLMFAVNIMSIKERNHPPLHGHRFISRAIAKATFRRYP